MSQTVELDAIFIALAVALFVFFLSALLVIIDHKAKIPGAETSDLFSITGIRRNHPAWAWMVSVFLWFIIGSLLVIISYNMLSKFFLIEVVKERSFLEKVDHEEGLERIRHFHNSPKAATYAQGKQPVCFYCHGEFPHAKRPMVRTLLNMHTQFVGCMTCHVDGKKIPEEELTFRWLNYSGIEVTGPEYGTSYDGDTGNLIQTDDLYSKIVPYRKKANGEEELLEIPETALEAAEFISMRGQLTTQQQGSVKKMFHTIVNPIGRFCTRCHVAEEGKGYLPFRELGFSDARAIGLTNLNIAGLVQKYKEFYMELVFLGKEDDEETKILVGEEPEAIEVTDEMQDDPRAWWRQGLE
ncbi:hypothetical protein MNBD_GAMMA26-1790 [hydrothermal vent metagenome]|uniref:Uncharacterized protein n=1 Tax=hydrothermal vent metagenome TaxID=652676 RepID=A0A3B1C217_9ZZZZ